MFQSYTKMQNIASDYGPEPYITNIENMAIANKNYRTAIWTGEHLQTTLMSINPNDDIGLEIHPNFDQMIIVVNGRGVSMMGKEETVLNKKKNVRNGFAVFIPAGTWHNIINTGSTPLKLISVYAPPAHPRGTIHQTKEIAEQEESGY